MTGKTDRRKRCEWSLASERYIAYHDEEWGVPVHDDLKQFEFLVLESAQAGLSWATILNKRDAYRRAFAGFDPAKVARFRPARIDKLLQDPGIVRNRAKVEAAVNNARRFLDVQEAFGSFAAYIWDFVDGRTIVNRWKTMDSVPAHTEHSDRLATDMKRRGFRFVGSTILYSHMQATGLVNDHLLSCFRHGECKRLARPQ